MDRYGALFGLSMPFKLMTEREMTGRVQRINPYDSCNLSLEVSANRLWNIDHQDYMGKDSPNSNQFDIHELLGTSDEATCAPRPCESPVSAVPEMHQG